MTTASLYGRASTDRQGDTINHQISLLSEMARKRGWAIDERYIYEDEDVSASKVAMWDRPSMRRLLTDAKSGKFDVVMFKGISRFARDTEEAISTANRLKAAGLRIISIEENFDSETAASDLFFTIHASMAAFESEKLAVRVRLGYIEKAKKGLWSGRTPYGYQKGDDGRLEPDDYAWVVSKIFELYINGLGSHRIMKWLYDNSVSSPTGGKFWTERIVMQIVRNPAYTGTLVYNRRTNTVKRNYGDDGRLKKVLYVAANDEDEWVTVPDAHEVIVEQETFDEAQQVAIGRFHQKRVPNKRYALTGIAKCGRCGSGLVGVKSRQTTSKRTGRTMTYLYYKCGLSQNKGIHACPGVHLKAGEFELEILDSMTYELKKLWEHINGDDGLKQREKELVQSELTNRIKQLDKEIERLARNQQRLDDNADLYDSAVWREKMLTVKNDMDRLRKLRTQAEAELQSESSKDTQISELLNKFFNADMGDYEQFIWAVNEFIDTITATKYSTDILYRFSL